MDYDTEEKLLWGLWGFCMLASLAMTAGIVFVVIHFAMKWW